MSRKRRTVKISASILNVPDDGLEKINQVFLALFGAGLSQESREEAELEIGGIAEYHVLDVRLRALLSQGGSTETESGKE